MTAVVLFWIALDIPIGIILGKLIKHRGLIVPRIIAGQGTDAALLIPGDAK